MVQKLRTWASRVGENEALRRPHKPDGERSSSAGSTSTRFSSARATTTPTASAAAWSASCCWPSSASPPTAPRRSPSRTLRLAGIEAKRRARVRERPRHRSAPRRLAATRRSRSEVRSRPPVRRRRLSARADDVARIQEYLQANDATETVCWLPNFLSRELRNDLGTLVVLEYVLTGERLLGLTEDLPAADRPTARQLLTNQRDALRQRVKLALAQAYGATGPSDGMVAVELDPAEQFRSLDPGFEPRPPVGPALAKALEGICHQLMEHRYPAHPQFESDVKDAAIQTVLVEALRAVDAEADNGRIEVKRSRRAAMTAVAQPLRLGIQYETAFLLDHHWQQHFDQQHAATGGALP